MWYLERKPPPQPPVKPYFINLCHSFHKPVLFTSLISVFLQVQSCDLYLNHLLYLLLWNTSKPRKQCEYFSSSQNIKQGIKLHAHIHESKYITSLRLVYTPEDSIQSFVVPAHSLQTEI